MVKSKSAKRKRNAPAEVSNKLLKTSSTITPPPDNGTVVEPKSLQTVVSDDELEITIETLQLLSQYPNLIKSKACKDLRVAVYDFKQACTTGMNTSEDTNLTARISAALTDGKYTEALILLAEMRIRGESPKLGALCRWVRDLDVVSGLSMQVDGVSQVVVERSEQDRELLRVLDAVLRVTGPTDLNSAASSLSTNPMSLQKIWSMRDGKKRPREVYKSVFDKSIFENCPKDVLERFRIIETTTGPLRKPPNHHPAILYTSKDDAILLSTTGPETSYHKHPTVPNMSLIKDVLSPEECTSIIAAAESIGFIPDAPIREGDEEASILAHNFYWVVDQAFHDKLWERVKPYVPESVAGRKARGINRRFRVYRYVPGAEYRCHIGM
jgi:hypothetical protein